MKFFLTTALAPACAAGGKFTFVFHLQAGPWNGPDIFRLELKKPAPPKKTGR